MRGIITMKCKSCPLGEKYVLHLLPEHGGDIIDLVQCPFGDKAFHLADRRCTKFTQRKDAIEGKDIDEEQISEID